MTEKVYLVIKTSVYRHDVFGAFDDFENARSLADELASTDIDGHHGYDVIPVPLNSHYKITLNSTNGNETDEDVAIYSAAKQI